MGTEEANKRLGSSICQKIFNLFLAEKEFMAMMAAKMEKFRQELGKEFGELPLQEKIQFMRQELNSYSDEEFGAMFGITMKAIRAHRSKAGIDRNLNGHLTKSQRRLVIKASGRGITRFSKEFGCHKDYLMAIRKAHAA